MLRRSICLLYLLVLLTLACTCVVSRDTREREQNGGTSIGASAAIQDQDGTSDVPTQASLDESPLLSSEGQQKWIVSGPPAGSQPLPPRPGYEGPGGAAAGSPPWPEELDRLDPSLPLGESEVLLRSKVLWAVTGRYEREKEVRTILSQPLSVDAIAILGSIILEDPASGHVRAGPYQTVALLDYLALRASAGDGEMVKAIKEIFEKVFERAQVKDSDDWAHQLRLWPIATNAVENYGSAVLLTPAFWNGFEQGLAAARVLEAVGDKEVLSMLKEFEPHCPWENATRRRILGETILLIEARLKYPELRDVRDRLTRLQLAKELMRDAP